MADDGWRLLKLHELELHELEVETRPVHRRTSPRLPQVYRSRG